MVLNYDGKEVRLGNHVDIMGSVEGISGVGALALVFITTLYNDSLSTQANALYAQQNDSAAPSGSSWDGKNFAAGDRVYVPCRVTAITGDGVTAQLTVTLDQTGASATVSAGTVRSHG